MINMFRVVLTLLFVYGTIFSSGVYADKKQDLLTEAQQYLEKSEWRAGIIQLKNALKEDPEFVAARLLLGKTYIQLGDGAGAEKELRRARKYGASLAQWGAPLAEAYLLQRKSSDLLSEIKPSNELDGTLQANIEVMRAAAYLQLDRNIEAEKAFKRSLELAPNSVRVLLGNARYAASKNELAEASNFVESALKSEPKNFLAWTLKGELARQKQDYSEAQRAFNNALENNENHMPAQLGIAATLIALRDFGEAKQQLDKLLTKAPQHPLINYLSAVIYFEKRDLDATEAALQKVFRVMPKHLPSLLMMGSVQYAKNQFEQAANYLSQFHVANKTHVPAVKLLAATRLKLKEPKKALKVLRAAEKNVGDDPQFLSLLGTAYLQSGQLDKGSEYLEKAVQIAPDAASIRTQLGLSYLASGDTEQAVSTLESAVELGHDVMQADILLILAHLKDKKFDKALTVAKAFAKKHPENPLPHNFMGAAYLGKENIAAARTQFNKALKIKPSYVSAIMNLAQLDEREKNIKGAKQRYQQVLKLKKGHIGASMAMAKIAAVENNETKMVAFLESSINAHPGAIQPSVSLANYHIQKDNPLRAVEILTHSRQQFPNNFVVLEKLGRAQILAKNPTNAVSTLKNLVKHYPQMAKAHFLLGQAEAATEDSRSAKRHFKKAIQLDNKFMEGHIGLAALALKEKQYDEVRKIGKSLQKAFPKQAAGWILEGDAFFQQDKLKKAVKAYTKAYPIGKNTALTLKLASVQNKIGKSKEATSTYQSWLEINPSDLPVRVAYAEHLQAQNHIQEAVANYEKAVQQQPNHVAILNNLAWLYTGMKDKRALQYGAKAFELASNNPAVADTYGWALTNLGDAKRGLVLLQQASMQAPHMAEIKYHLSVALAKNGKTEQARKELQRLIDTEQDASIREKAKAFLATMSNG